MKTILPEAPADAPSLEATGKRSLRKLSRSERRKIAEKGAAMTAAAWLESPEDLVADVIDEFDSTMEADG